MCNLSAGTYASMYCTLIQQTQWLCVTLHFAETIFGGGDVAAGGCHTAGQRGDRGPMRCEGKSLVICPRICKYQSGLYMLLIARACVDTRTHSAG